MADPGARPDAPLLARLALPAGLGAAGLAAVVAVGLRDPHVPGSWGHCPFLQFTGLYCPGCGGLRAVNDLVHLRFLDALHSNGYGIVFAIGAAIVWLIWLVARARNRPARLDRVVTQPVAWALLAALIVFSVLRNTPWGTWLAPV